MKAFSQFLVVARSGDLAEVCAPEIRMEIKFSLAICFQGHIYILLVDLD